jgi:RNA polymerase sigma factor (sigma-70 family)
VTPPNEEFAVFYRATVDRTFRAACLMARGDRQVAWDATQDAYARLLNRWNIREFQVTDETPVDELDVRGRTRSNGNDAAIRRPEGAAQGVDAEEGLRDLHARVLAYDWTRLTGRERNTACLVAARAGDRAAFAALVNDLTPLVWHVARSSGLSRIEAEDVGQTVWLQLLRHIHRLDDPRALAAWLITTTRREAIHTRRRTERTRTTELTDTLSGELAATDPSPEDLVLRGDRDRAIWTAFHRLTPRCQELLRLTVLSGRAEYRVVAEAMDVPVGGIGPTRGRCLKTLREYYEAET